MPSTSSPASDRPATTNHSRHSPAKSSCLVTRRILRVGPTRTRPAAPPTANTPSPPASAGRPRPARTAGHTPSTARTHGSVAATTPQTGERTTASQPHAPAPTPAADPRQPPTAWHPDTHHTSPGQASRTSPDQLSRHGPRLRVLQLFHSATPRHLCGLPGHTQPPVALQTLPSALGSDVRSHRLRKRARMLPFEVLDCHVNHDARCRA